MTRAKSNLNAHQMYSVITGRTACVIADQTITLDGHYTRRDYECNGTANIFMLFAPLG